MSLGDNKSIQVNSQLPPLIQNGLNRIDAWLTYFQDTKDGLVLDHQTNPRLIRSLNNRCNESLKQLSETRKLVLSLNDQILKTAALQEQNLKILITTIISSVLIIISYTQNTDGVTLAAMITSLIPLALTLHSYIYNSFKNYKDYNQDRILDETDYTIEVAEFKQKYDQVMGIPQIQEDYYKPQELFPRNSSNSDGHHQVAIDFPLLEEPSYDSIPKLIPILKSRIEAIKKTYNKDVRFDELDYSKLSFYDRISYQNKIKTQISNLTTFFNNYGRVLDERTTLDDADPKNSDRIKELENQMSHLLDLLR